GVPPLLDEQGLVAREAPLLDRLLHHPERGPVLHRSAGVGELELGVDLDRGRLAHDPVEPHERRVADGGRDRAEAAGADERAPHGLPSARTRRSSPRAARAPASTSRAASVATISPGASRGASIGPGAIAPKPAPRA